jgi:gas vesicle protein
MQEEKQKKDHFLAGLLIGASIGAIVGILYAPAEGKATRKKLTFQLSKLREKLLVLLQDIKDGKEQHVSLAKTKGEQVISEAKGKAEKLLNDVESLMEQIKNK